MARLIGAPPGYVGYEEGGQLSEAVRRRPYSVVLFDEIEKAHHDVFNVLLQVLDDGRLTDGQGRTVDFKNTHRHHDEQHRLADHPGVLQLGKLSTPRNMRRWSSVVRTELRAHFRPEFLNRVDDIIIFHSLDEKQLAQHRGHPDAAAGKTPGAAEADAWKWTVRPKS